MRPAWSSWSIALSFYKEASLLAHLLTRPSIHLGHSLADLLGPEDHADDVLCDLFRGEPCRFTD